MTNIEIADLIDKLEIMLKDVKNLSLVNEDVIIHRNKIGLDCEHLTTLAQIITYKINLINDEFDKLINGIKE